MSIKLGELESHKGHYRDYTYDLFVYIITGIFIALVYSATFLDSILIRDLASAAGIYNKTILLVISLCVFYVYGMLISVFSDVVIKKPLKLLPISISKGGKFFSFDFPKVIDEYFDEEDLKVVNGHASNYWPIIYMLKAENPELILDLAKLYTRAKMARMNAMNILIFSIFLMFNLEYVENSNSLISISIGGMNCIFISVTLAVAFIYEYYFRQRHFGESTMLIFAAYKSSRKREPTSGDRSKNSDLIQPSH